MKYFAQKCESIEKKWSKKTPKEKWKFCHKIGDYSLRIIGVNTFNDNRVYCLSYLSYVVVVGYVMLAIYTVYVYISENNPMECINCFCVGGVMLSV